MNETNVIQLNIENSIYSAVVIECYKCEGRKLEKPSPFISNQVRYLCIRCEGKGVLYSRFVSVGDKEALELEILARDFLPYNSRLHELENPISPF